MAYKRKTKDAVELSAACRRAALSRRTNGGGRPRQQYNDMTGRSIKVAWRDGAIIRAYANESGLTIKDAVHKLAALIVNGGTVTPRPYIAPVGWEYRLANR